MDNNQTSVLTQEEKLISMFAHLSVFFGGLILPFIFWLLNKDKSKFATFNSLQALWFHLAYVVILCVTIVVFVIVIIIAGAGVGALAGKGGELSAFMIIVIVAFYALIFLTMFAVMGYSVYMGIKSYRGEIVKYPFIGSIVYKRVYGGYS